jgi:hypothetical protein
VSDTKWQTCKRAGVECAGCGRADTCTMSPDGTAFKCWRDGGKIFQTKPRTGKKDGRDSGTATARKSYKKPAATYATADAAIDSVAHFLPGAKLVAAWTYYTIGGDEFARVARFDLADGSKQFRPIHRIVNGWKIGDPPGPWPLYRVGELPDFGAVFVAEGEKACDAARDIGLPTTTSAHGSAAATKTNWSPLAGRDVVILRDNDQPGLKYAMSVANILTELDPPARVKILLLPDLPKGGDVVEFLEARDSVETETIVKEVEMLAAAVEPVKFADVAVDAAGEKIFAGDPIPLERPAPPDFPPGSIPGALGRFIDAIARETETPRALPCCIGLSAVAAVSQGTFQVNPEPGYFEPLALWVVPVLEPGTRKTAVFSRMTDPHMKWESARRKSAELEISTVTALLKSHEARVDRLRSDAAKSKSSVAYEKATAEIAELELGKPNVPIVPCLLADDVTPEHVATIMGRNDERIAIMSDEGGSFSTIAGRYSKGVANVDIFNKAFSASFVKVDRGSRPPIFLAKPVLTFGLAVQPVVVRELAKNPTLRHSGFVDRFLWTLPDPRLGHRQLEQNPTPAPIADDYEKLILELADVEKVTNEYGERVPHTLKLSQGAYTLWKGFQREVETMLRDDGALKHLRGWASKLPGTTARIAGVIHVAGLTFRAVAQREIQADTMAAAVSLARLFIDHAVVVFDAMKADTATEAAKSLWAIIERNRKITFTARDVWHPLRGTYKRVADVEPGFVKLVDHRLIGEIPSTDDRTLGRPAKRLFRVHPQIVEGWR